MYGRHGTLRAQRGRRDELLAVLQQAARDAPTMPGCHLYLVGKDLDDPDAIAVTEVWEDKAAHAASLKLESVRATIAKGRPLIAGIGAATEFEVVGGLPG
jgi:quinol monooxygenase YgiN